MLGGHSESNREYHSCHPRVDVVAKLHLMTGPVIIHSTDLIHRHDGLIITKWRGWGQRTLSMQNSADMQVGIEAESYQLWRWTGSGARIANSLSLE